MLSNGFTRLDDEVIKSIRDICQYTYEKCKPHFINTRIALDVGCKAGNFAKHIQKDFATVHMFDMRPKVKWRNIDTRKCKLHQCALGDHNGTISFNGAITNQSGEIAELKTIDSFNFTDIDFIKIDVEGDEQSVLQGAVKTLEACHPIVVLEQNHATEKYGKGKYGDAVRWLEKNKYKIIDYDGMDDWIMAHV